MIRRDLGVNEKSIKDQNQFKLDKFRKEKVKIKLRK